MNNEKIYVALDAANDIKYYNAFKENFKMEDGSSYNFYDGIEYYKELDKISDDDLKLKIQKNMDDATIVVALLSKTLKSMRKFSKWQIEYAIKAQKPIIVINTTRIRSLDYDICPTPLKSNISLHIPYDKTVFNIAVNNWPSSHKKHLENPKDLKKIYKYSEEMYKEIFSEEE